MAKWVELQYLLYINEITYAKRQEILLRQRDDEYGRGYILYAEKYPLNFGSNKSRPTPFNTLPPL